MNQEPSVSQPPLRRFKDADYIPLCANLAEVRANIDQLDREIVALIADRGRYVKDAARFKADSFQVSAPNRQQEVFDRVVALAHEHGAYPEVVEACYRAMVAGFIAREQTYFTDMEPVEEGKK